VRLTTTNAKNTAKDWDGKTPVDWSTDNPHPEVREMLRK